MKLETYEYKPFGDSLSESPRTGGEPSGSGGGREGVSDFIAPGARMYSPDLGTFHVRRSAVRGFPRAKLVSYAYNNPMGFSDPTGLSPKKERGLGIMTKISNTADDALAGVFGREASPLLPGVTGLWGRLLFGLKNLGEIGGGRGSRGVRNLGTKDSFAESDGEQFGARTGEPSAAGGGGSPGPGGSGGRTREEQIFGATPDITTVGVCPQISPEQVLISDYFTFGVASMWPSGFQKRHYANKINEVLRMIWSYGGAKELSEVDLSQVEFVITNGKRISEIHRCKHAGNVEVSKRTLGLNVAVWNECGEEGVEERSTVKSTLGCIDASEFNDFDADRIFIDRWVFYSNHLNPNLYGPFNIEGTDYFPDGLIVISHEFKHLYDSFYNPCLRGKDVEVSAVHFHEMIIKNKLRWE